jgi:medium-chain acyl-[acyl-carrier-protein] hydrolase
VLVARDADRLLGNAMIRAADAAGSRQWGDRVGTLETLPVAGGARGTGTGRGLLDAARGRLAEWGARVMAISVIAGNEGAERFYRREGASDYLHTLMICLPYAGGSAAAFREWPQMFSDEVEVVPIEPPGHGSRLAEPPLYDVHTAAAGAAEALLPYLDRPFALFGHSFGALLGFELARELHTDGLSPACFFASGSRAPRVTARRYLSALTDDALVDLLRQLNGTPTEILQNRQLVDLLLPAVRADLVAGEAYVAPATAMVDCPIVALAGRDDSVVAPGEIAAWAEVTRAEFELWTLPGDHFFVHASLPLVSTVIHQGLQHIIGGFMPAAPAQRSAALQKRGHRS